MSALKPQPTSGAVQPQYATVRWPPLQLPEPDPRVGMTAEHAMALQEWYTGLQNSINTHVAALHGQITQMSSQIEKLNSTLKIKG